MSSPSSPHSHRHAFHSVSAPNASPVQISVYAGNRGGEHRRSGKQAALRALVAAVAVLVSLLQLSGCGGGWGEFKPKVTGLADLTVKVGDTAKFTAQATGTGPITLQWYRNDVPIQGATNASYQLIAKAEDDGTTFTVGAQNAGGTTMASGKLTVLAAPAITKQPENQEVVGGATASFSVAATGTAPLSYQWFKNGQSIAGATTAQYSTPATSMADGGEVFTVTITNQVGSITSAPATLAVDAAPGSLKPSFTFAVADQTYGTPPFAVAAKSNSPGAITYTVVSGPATVSGNMVSLTGTGAVVLAANLASTGQYAAATVTTTFNVAPAAPSLNFHVSDHAFGTAPFPVTASSSSPAAVTYTVVSGPATVSGNVVSLTGSGPVTLKATQAADGNYAAGSVTATFTALPATPTIAFPVADKTFGSAPFAINATSNSSGAFTYGVVSGPATVAGNIITLTGTGTVVLSANQAAAGDYAAGSKTASFAVYGETPTLSFTVPNKTFQADPFPVVATSNSPGAITYTVVSGPATVTGNNVTLTGSGTVVLSASQAAAGDYVATSATTTFTVGMASPTISFHVADQSYGAAPFAVAATSNSSGTITYSVVSGPATIAGSTVTLTGAGVVVLSADQAASSLFTAGSAKASFNVGAETPTMTFKVSNQTYGAAPFPVTATSDSGAPVTYQVVSGPATVAGNVVSLTGAGTVVLSASQAAAGNFGAISVTTSFAVGAETPTMTFSVGNQTYGNAPFQVNATTNSPAPVTYTVVSGPATVSGNTVTLTGAGTVVLSANQPASGGYSAGSATATFTAGADNPTISFQVANQTYGAAPFAVNATSNSTGAFTYAVVSGPATLSGNTVTLTGTGTVVLSAAQAAAGHYNAGSATATFTVSSEIPTITFGVPNQTIGGQSATLSATSNSAGAFTYTVISGPATISGNTLVSTGVGTVVVQATQAAAGNYASGSSTATFTIGQGTPVLTLNPIADQTYGATVNVAAASTETGAGAPPITYVVTGPATLSGSTLTTTGVGKVTVTASQAATIDYAAATTSVSFNVGQNAPTVSLNAIPDQTYSGPSVAVVATSSATGTGASPITLTVTGPATLSGNTLTTTGIGKVTVTATQAASTDFAAASASTSFVVNPATPTLTLQPIADQTYGGASISVVASSTASDAQAAPITYSVTGPATLSGNVLTTNGVGKVTVTANQAASGNYAAAAPVSTSFTVGQATPTLTLAPIGNQSYGAVVSVSATSTENNPKAPAITYTVTGPATVSGTTISTNGVGKVTVTATQAASADYAGASTSTSFNITPANPSLTIASLSNQSVGATVTVSAVSSENGTGAPPLVYNVTGPATISGNVITTTGVGTVIVTVSQVATTNYNAASATASFSVGQGSPTLTITPVPNQTYGGPSITVKASSTSTEGPITYSVTGPATVSGSTVSTNGVGTVVVTASQAASTNYAAANVSTSFTVGQATPKLTLGTIADQLYGASVVANASSTSTGQDAAPITFSVTGPASLSGSTLMTTGIGKVTLTASQGASTNYTAAASVSTTFNVGQATPKLSIQPIADQTYGAAPVTAIATSTETGPNAAPITYTVTGPATIAGSQITATGVGNITVAATQAASADYTAASVSTSFNVGKAKTVLTINPIADQAYGASVVVSATSTDTDPAAPAITYTVSGPATVSGSTVTATGVGKVTVTANQGGSTNFDAATSVSTSFNIGQGTPTLSITPIADQVYGAVVIASATSTASGSDAGAITFSVTGPASLSGNSITATGIGKVTVTATQAASTTYKAASATISFNVSKATPVLTIKPIADQTYGGTSPVVTVISNETGSDAGTITYAVSGPATIAGTTITTNGVGKVVITATQAPSTNYNGASVSTTFNVNQATPTLTVTPIANQTYGGPAITINATSNSQGAINYSLSSDSPAKITGNVVTTTGVGTVTMMVSQAATANYTAPNAVTLSFAVVKATPVLTIASIPDQTLGVAVVTANASSTSAESPITYTVNGPATIVGRTIVVSGTGKVTVTASQAASTDYNAPASASTSFQVYATSFPSILTQPLGQMVCTGAPFSLSISASNATSFQWYQNGQAISGATGATLNVGTASASNQGSYYVVARNSNGTVTSATVTVTVGATITASPASLKIGAGQLATFAVSVSGEAPFTYQWYSIAANASVGTLISGATGSSYTTPLASLANNNTRFYVVVTDACGTAQVSAAATLTVQANTFPPTILQQPVSQVVSTGSSNVSFTVTATGSGTLSYQWYQIPAGQITASKVTGATSSSYTLPATATANSDDGDQYYVIVSNSYGQAVSQKAYLTVGSGIQITKQPQTVYVNSGNSATFSVTAVSSLSLTYQWYKAAPGSATFTAIAGATASSYTIDSAAAADSGSTYYVIVSNGATNSVTSSTVAEFVDALVNIPQCSTAWNVSGTAFALTSDTTTTNDTCGYQLTAAAQAQKGAIVWPSLIATGNVQLKFTVTTSSPSNPPADGFAVVFGDPSLGATVSSLGSTGAGLGAEGIPGTVLAFDDYYNYGDPSVPYVGITRGEAALWEQPYFYLNSGIPSLATPGEIVTHSYVVTLASGTLTVSMDGLQILSGPVVLPPVAYLYVTSSTGSLYEQTQITDLSATISPVN